MGVFLRKEFDNDSELLIWEITESEEQLRGLSSVPNEELEEIDFIRSQSRRKEKLAIRALLDVKFMDKVYLGHHDNGKPFIQNNVVEISISHTSSFAALYTHPVECVGVDIECVNRDFSKVASRFLSEEELEEVPSKDGNTYLAVCWSAKEAVYKLKSQMSVDFATQIRIEKFNLKDEGSLEAIFIGRDGVEEEIPLEYMFFRDHVAVWCCND